MELRLAKLRRVVEPHNYWEDFKRVLDQDYPGGVAFELPGVRSCATYVALDCFLGYIDYNA
jgi:hypothetical protein